MSDKPDGFLTVDEFLQRVTASAADCGYGWLNVGRHHPEDIAINLVPVMQAWAAGYTEGVRRMRGKA